MLLAGYTHQGLISPLVKNSVSRISFVSYLVTIGKVTNLPSAGKIAIIK